MCRFSLKYPAAAPPQLFFPPSPTPLFHPRHALTCRAELSHSSAEQRSRLLGAPLDRQRLPSPPPLPLLISGESPTFGGRMTLLGVSFFTA